jgi:pyruvate/2-oxoglutarate dehydrogenase complex dihydrolipoamide acyltransferase (E2) component
MGKILSQAGSQKIPVGQIIAVLAEEGDDLSTLEVPGDLSPPSSASTSGQPEPEKKDQSMTEKKELASTPSASSTSSSTPPSTQDSSASPKSGTPTPAGQRQNAPQAGRETENKAEKIQKGGVPVDVGGHKGNVHGGASGRPLFPSVMRL